MRIPALVPREKSLLNSLKKCLLTFSLKYNKSLERNDNAFRTHYKKSSYAFQKDFCNVFDYFQ